jgi:DNA polymerase III epsilon subunit-like protein
MLRGLTKRLLMTSSIPPRLVFLDIESTIDSLKQTIEIAAVSDTGNVVQTLVAVDSYRHPGYRLGTWIHGITPDMIRSAPSFPSALDHLVTFLEAERSENIMLVAHNGRAFDFPVLMRQATRHGIDLRKRLERAGVRSFIDTHPLFQGMKKRGVVPSGRLTELYTHFTGSTLDGAHRAMADARALRDVCSFVSRDNLLVYRTEL